jgi:NADH-quinone oxidoreductase subunit J
MSAIGNIYFYVCAVLALLGALGTVMAPNPIRGAMGLLLMILSIAGLFLALHAQFLAAVQLIVYAGAIVVLFLFVIMLLGPSASPPTDQRGQIPRIIGAALFGLTGAGAMVALYKTIPHSVMGPTGYPSVGGDFGSIDAFGRIVFSQVLVPFELSSALLMVSIVGAVAVARGRHISDPPSIHGSATFEPKNLPHAGQAPRSAGGLTREAP